MWGHVGARRAGDRHRGPGASPRAGPRAEPDEKADEQAHERADSATDPRRVGPDIFELDGELAKKAAGGTNVDNWVFRDALLPYVIDGMHPSVVLGHFRYRDRYVDLAGRAHFVTVLRDPVDRIVSLVQVPALQRRNRCAGVDDPRGIPATPRWAKEGHIYVDTFCGRDRLDPRSDEAITAAVANLRHFAVVGFTESLDDFSARVTACIGKEVSVPMYNTSPAPDDTETDEDALALARTVCAPDIAVYEKALAARG